MLSLDIQRALGLQGDIWQDPQSGIKSYILKKQIAPLQQSFYFTSPSISADGRYYWFYVAFPPAGSAEIGRSLALLNFETGDVHYFPDTQFRDASPMVDPLTGEVYWAWEYAVYKRKPHADAPVEFVNKIPEEIHQHRYGKRLATHLTMSADRKSLFIDAHLGNEWIAGSLPLDGGDFELWQTFDRCFNHAQFNPKDPELALIAQDWWIDVATGERGDFDDRIWTIRLGEQAQSIFGGENGLAHEWWDADGEHIWFVNYANGTERVNIHSNKRELVWPNGTCHSHASNDGKYLVGDIGTYSWSQSGCRVAFYNIETAKEINIASELPVPKWPRGDYHIDPHPQFCLNDQLIAYTTTVRGGVDVAFCVVDDLLKAT